MDNTGNISYAAFKQIVQSPGKELPVYFIEPSEDVYVLYSAFGTTGMVASVATEDVADFETWKSSCTLVTSGGTDDGVLLAMNQWRVDH